MQKNDVCEAVLILMTDSKMYKTYNETSNNNFI